MRERPPFNALVAKTLQTKFNVLLCDFQRDKTLIQGTLDPEVVKEKVLQETTLFFNSLYGQISAKRAEVKTRVSNSESLAKLEDLVTSQMSSLSLGQFSDGGAKLD